MTLFKDNFNICKEPKFEDLKQIDYSRTDLLLTY